MLSGSQVICSTLVGAGSDVLAGMTFPIVVLDEGSQATEPECLIPICKVSVFNTNLRRVYAHAHGHLSLLKTPSKLAYAETQIL